MSQVSVRLVRPSDRTIYTAMRQMLWPDTPEATHRAEIEAIVQGKSPTWPQSPFTAWLGFVDDEPAGLLEVSTRPFVDGCAIPPVAYVEAAFVVPEHRRSGVARAMVDAAVGWAKGFGVLEMMGDAHPDDDPALFAFEALGFEEVRRQVSFSRLL